MPVIRFKTSLLLAVVFIVAELLLLSLFYARFPLEIPVHFNRSGMPDRYDEKYVTYILLGVDIIVVAIPLLVLYLRRNKLSPAAVVLLNLFLIVLALGNLASMIKLVLFSLGNNVYKAGWGPFLIEKGAIAICTVLIFLLLSAAGKRNRTDV